MENRVDNISLLIVAEASPLIKGIAPPFSRGGKCIATENLNPGCALPAQTEEEQLAERYPPECKFHPCGPRLGWERKLKHDIQMY
jgi:hypothetical protein